MGHPPYLQQYRSLTVPTPINTAGRPWGIHSICSSIYYTQHQHCWGTMRYQPYLQQYRSPTAPIPINTAWRPWGHPPYLQQYRSLTVSTPTNTVGTPWDIHHICGSIGHQHHSTLLRDHEDIHHIYSSIGHQHQSTLLGDHGAS